MVPSSHQSIDKKKERLCLDFNGTVYQLVLSSQEQNY